MRRRAVIVMAAGQGTRMKSKQAKVLHAVAGRPMIAAPIESALALGAAPIVVVLGHQREAVEAYLQGAFPGAPIVTVLQAQQRGTADAVRCAEPALEGFDGDVFILSGDVPTLPTARLEALDAAAGEAPLAVMGMRLDDPKAYGRLICDEAGRLIRITEHRDCAPEARLIREVNAGIYRVDARLLFRALGGVRPDNDQGELYLTDLVALAAREGREIAHLILEGEAAADAEGVNDRVDLAAAEARAQRRLIEAAMRAGVTFLDPRRARLEWATRIGPDTVVGLDVTLAGATVIGEGVTLEQGVHLRDTIVADGVHLKPYTTAEGAQIGPGCVVGPFARLREGTALSAGVKIGNFVETKKARLAEGVKASHLSYLGDVEIGAGANIGAGTITCNYDGVHKHKTIIGAGAFIGSDTQLVAPVEIGDGAYVGAGSTITHAVPQEALAISRVHQRNIEGWARRKRLEREEG
ncbi:bifunctional UDP-N-acetylglucosamine diphosphorylase/glucosamine-1-phosphate N-acetyltransferase GlmU [Myxococcota bacterium]|nr:bifunctional UDP-N-acetylglucosamine diphosphorylase/glucosamine-1-phosphate N-acetyltransferase GlmU [Myxococcota bacterium]MBU1431034.1 bifunctional UDP-N-acetylglucosamine diphosphorylase/glucosamine-1-phosphate N-acetyltransferase GlmU [Myxococcota bacterium]MBU1896761.1 bifunctional UDP-N-acetylglucosamine diphosphorylase/glucosamine-1-phosphate N-acetyltransferase GlmU [Myxococcota bacterium]